MTHEHTSDETEQKILQRVRMSGLLSELREIRFLAGEQDLRPGHEGWHKAESATYDLDRLFRTQRNVDELITTCMSFTHGLDDTDREMLTDKLSNYIYNTWNSKPDLPSNHAVTNLLSWLQSEITAAETEEQPCAHIFSSYDM